MTVWKRRGRRWLHSRPRRQPTPAVDRRRWLALAAAPLLLAAPAWADRLPGQGWPWSAVGRVLTDGAGPCSGVLIEPRLVLTVGHCVAGGRPWRAKAVERLAVQFDDESVAVAAVDIAGQSPFAPDGAIGDLSHDWAFLQLEGQPSVDPVRYGGTAAARHVLVFDEPLFKVGWRGDERRRNVACTILEIAPDGRLLSFRCPGGPGQGRSGSALLARVGDDWQVVGVQTAESTSASRGVGIAVSR